MAFCIHHFEYSIMTFSALYCQAIGVGGLAPLRKLQCVWGLPSGKFFQATPYLGHSAIVSDFWINMVNIMRPRVALGFTLNMFQF